MKIWHISDTHGHHRSLTVPDDVTAVVHTGDAANSLSPYENQPQLTDFIEWLSSLPVERKIFVPGNHDTSLEKGLIKREDIEKLGIECLIERETVLFGFRVFGTPWVPRYGNWAWMSERHKIGRKWHVIPDDVQILLSHGPGYGTLDATVSRNGEELVGCSALAKRIASLTDLKLHCFGHVHDCEDIRNSGLFRPSGSNTLFSNAACAKDGVRDKIVHTGNIIDLSKLW